MATTEWQLDEPLSFLVSLGPKNKPNRQTLLALFRIVAQRAPYSVVSNLISVSTGVITCNGDGRGPKSIGLRYI